MSGVFREKLLQGKTAFITGGSSGINLRIAERFAEHGARLAILARKPEKLEAAAAQLRGIGAEVHTFAVDVRDAAAMANAFTQAHEALGEIDIVIAGAAGNFPSPAAQLSPNGFKSVVDIDVHGTFNTYRSAFEHLRKPGASLISISANQGTHPMPMQAHVCAAKAGVDMLTRTLAYEWGPLGVRSNCIAPGPVADTEGMDRLTPTEESRTALIGTIPLRRYASKDEIADVALFLCTPVASFITGTVIVVDGGASLGTAFAQAMGF